MLTRPLCRAMQRKGVTVALQRKGVTVALQGHARCSLSMLSTATSAHNNAHPPPFDIQAITRELAAEHALQGSGMSYNDPRASWHWLDREMSSNMAGETGAVCIYDGAAAALRLRANVDPEVLRFVEEHREAEQAHLDLFAALLPAHKHTRLLPMWRLAGFALGFLPACIGDRYLFKTVEAVETFVEVHYHEQINPLREHGRCPQLVELLEHCCADEVHHKEDAAARSGGGETGYAEYVWMAVVKLGSAAAAEVARRV